MNSVLILVSDSERHFLDECSSRINKIFLFVGLLAFWEFKVDSQIVFVLGGGLDCRNMERHLLSING